MGILGNIGKGLLAGAGFLGAPFTGGASMAATAPLFSKIGKTVASIAKVAGPTATGLAAGKQKGREAENTAAQDEAAFKLRESGQHEGQLMDRQTLALRQKEQAQVAQKNAYDLARRSALAMNMKDVTVSGVPKDVPVIHFNGGMRPSAFGKEGMNAATAINRLAMQKLMDGEGFDKLPDLERTGAPAFKKPGAMENILGGVATGANAINGANADREQNDFQSKILAAIEALTQGGKPLPKIGTNGLRTALGTATPPALAGVTPFFKPPTGQNPYDPNADWSNR